MSDFQKNDKIASINNIESLVFLHRLKPDDRDSILSYINAMKITTGKYYELILECTDNNIKVKCNWITFYGCNLNDIYIDEELNVYKFDKPYLASDYLSIKRRLVLIENLEEELNEMLMDYHDCKFMMGCRGREG